MFSPPDYSAPANFLDPQMGPWTAFLYLHRKPILDAVKEAVPILRGSLLDVGCGNKPYATLLKCSTHIGVDVENSPHHREHIDKIYDGTTLPFGEGEFDSLLCTEVLEHCKDPLSVVREIWRVLKPGGHALVTAPMVFHHHEEPWDFQRFTWFGMKNLAEDSGFDLIWIRPRGNTYSAGLGMLYTVLSQTLSKRPFIDVVLWILWPIALFVMMWDRKESKVPPPVSLGWQMLMRKPCEVPNYSVS